MVFLGLRCLVYDMHLWPNLGTKKTTLKNKRSYYMAVALKMFVVALTTDWVFVWDPDVESFCSEWGKYAWIECFYHANYKY
jgi:hypothetical protein